MAPYLPTLKSTLWGNSLQNWGIALLVLLVVLAGLEIAKSLLVKQVSHRWGEQPPSENLFLNLLAQTRFWFLLAVSLFVAASFLSLPPRADAAVSKLAVFALLLQGLFWGNGLISYLAARQVAKIKASQEEADLTSVHLLAVIGRVSLAIIILLVILDNLGINISALITGLGIGGIAAALALQNILGDLFAYISILMDKPFRIGDFITVDTHMGTVEHIGIKSTRIRSLSGEELIFSNSDLLKSRIRNYKRMTERRAVFLVGVVYQTPAEKLSRIPTLLKEAIEAQPGVRFDRAHFKEFGPSSLNFEAVYYVLDPNYTRYMDIQQAINLEICRRFQAEAIEFAYPTQTLYVHDVNKKGPLTESHSQ